MAETLQIMVLPAIADDSPPQVLFDDGGIWRDTTRLPFDSQSKIIQKIQQVLAMAMNQVGRQPSVPIDANAPGFRAPFADLYKQLLPPEVRDALKSAKLANGGAPTLHVYFHPGAEWVPWELLYDGDGFLGVEFAIARLPIVREPIEIRPPRKRVVQKVYSFLGKDVLQGPVLQYWQSTFQGFQNAPNWESRFPMNGDANFPRLTQLDEARGADVLHFTCHGGLKDQDEYFWSLDDQNPQFFDYRITVKQALTARLSARPLVFGNACASAIAQGDLKALLGFGPNFMVGGALNFVGTFAPITKNMAVTFARRFYTHLFGAANQPGLPIAEALRVTKRSLVDPSDPSYLFYCLYGPPDSTYKPA